MQPLCVKRDLAKRVLDRAEAELETARVAFAVATDVCSHEAKRRTLPAVDTPEFRAHETFLAARATYDKKIALAQLDPADAWEWVMCEYPPLGYDCVSGNDCWYRQDEDYPRHFSGGWECVFYRTTHICDVCYQNMDDDDRTLIATEAKASIMRFLVKQKHSGSVVEALLLDEHDEPEWKAETASSALKRALVPTAHEQWRFLETLAEPCISCDDDSPACYVLVGQPDVRLCKHHFAVRANHDLDLLDMLSTVCPAEKK